MGTKQRAKVPEGQPDASTARKRHCITVSTSVWDPAAGTPSAQSSQHRLPPAPRFAHFPPPYGTLHAGPERSPEM